ncbi:MAG TPA: hypothetical protein VK926_08125, partial [Gaiellaceae bacterium]|nr:hypothetical protein [Gaiellaceae bacterium]
MAMTEALVSRDPISRRSQQPPVLFEAKLDRVRSSVEALDRPRLTGLLRQSRAALVLVAAPPGFGKTTLLAQWRDGDDRAFASVSLDSADNDPALLWRYVVAAIRRAAPGFGEPALAALRGPRVDVLRDVVPAVLDELGSIGSEIVLALDDYQEIQSRACHDSVAFFVERLPANVTLALSTRVDPPIPLGRLRGLGRLLELRAADLCFTESEHEAFLNETLLLGLCETSLGVLHERTEGWPVGVRLAALSLRGVDDRAAFVDDFGGASRHVVDYLTEVVLDTLDEELRRFLLETSLLEWVSGPLCDAASGRTNSAELLARLERANLFLLPLDDRRERYRYHQLFGDVLRSQLLRTDGERAREVHRRASAWLADAGRTSEAIRHALAAGELETATGLVLERWHPSFDRGEAETSLRRLEAFPPWAIERDARLALVEAWSATVLNRRDEARRAVEAAESAVLDGMLPDGSSLEAGFALLRACFPGGDVGGMLTAALRASELEGDRGSAWQPVVLLTLGRAEYFAGRPELARPPL